MAYTLLDPTAKVLIKDCDANVAPTIDGDYIYFARKGLLARCRLDGSSLETFTAACSYKPFVDGQYVYFTADGGLYRCNTAAPKGTAQRLDDKGALEPFVDHEYVYFANSDQALFRRWKDGSGRAQMLDDRCYESPFVDGNYVYFSGGGKSLYRRQKDGGGAAQFLDGWCRTSVAVDGNYVYYVGKSGLFRRPKDGSGQEQILDDTVHAGPVVDGDHVYFSGGGSAGLYRLLKDGSGTPRLLHPDFHTNAAVKDDWVYFVAGTTLCRRRLHMESEWLDRKWETLKDVPLWQLAIPATHDSATYGEWQLVDEKRRSQCQDANIYEQLMYGYRCFDLRFMPFQQASTREGKDLSQYPFHHGSDRTNHTVEDVVRQICKFLELTSREIFILNMRADVWDRQKDSGYLHDPLSIEEERNIIKTICARIGHENIVTPGFVRSKGKEYFAGFTPAELVGEAEGTRRRVIVLWWGNHDLTLTRETGSGEVGDLVWFTASTAPEYQAENEFSGCMQANPIEVWRRDRVNIQKESHDRHINVAGSSDFTAACKGANLEASALDTLLRQPWNVIGGDFRSADEYLIGADLIVNGIQGSGVPPAER